MAPVPDGAPLFLSCDLLTRAGVHHLFTTRHFPGVTGWLDPGFPFGVEAVRVLEREGFGAGRPAFARQVHGARVLAVSRGGLAGEADAILCARPGLPVAVFTADCLPILIYDPVGRRLAAAHAGWRGTTRGVARAAVGALVEAGGRPGDFLAGIGPSIGPCCYEVDGPVVEGLDAAFPGRWQAWTTPAGPGRWRLDLWAANEAQLRDGGLGPGRIENLRLCTACRPDLFFSYRRGRGQGRLVALAAVPDGRRPAC